MKTILFLTILTQLALPQNGKMLLLFDSGYKNAETTLYLAGQTVSGSQATRIDNFITMLKDSLGITALSSKFDVMYLLANESATLGLRNLVKRSHDATAVNSPTFTQWEGFAGNGTSSYINTNWNGRTTGHAVAYSLNSGSFGLYDRTGVSGSNYDLHGAWSTGADGGSLNRIQLGFPAGGTNNYYYAINNSALVYLSSRTARMVVGSRTASNLITLYFNGSSVATSTASSNNIPNQNVLIGALMGETLDFYDANQFSFAFIGAGLTSTEVRQITNCIEYYMDALNKGIIP